MSIPHETQRLTSQRERKVLRSVLIGENAQNALEFQNRAVQKFGPEAGIFIRQVVFWDTRGSTDDDFFYKSRREMQRETGLNQRYQERARRRLREEGVLEEDVRPVGPLKRPTLHYKPVYEALLDLLYPAEEAVSTTGHGAEEDNPAYLSEKPPVEAVSTIQESTSREDGKRELQDLSPRARETVERCLSVLEEIEMNDIDRKRVENALPDLLARFPVLTNPVDTCRRYLDVVAAKQEPIKWHHKYLAGHFEREAAGVENEPTNPHGAGSERFKDKPNAARWYEAVYGGAVEDYEAMIRGGLTHSEIEAATARRTARSA